MKKIIQAENLFYNNYNMVNNELIDIIKNAFIEYYGEEFRGKIESVFLNLRIIYFSNNINQSIIDDRIKELNDSGLLGMELGYYSILKKKKKNESNKKIILMHNEICNGYCEYDEWIEENMISDGGSVQNSQKPTVYIQIEDDGIMYLQGLIHEINHSLMKDPLFIDEYGEIHYAKGIYECNDKVIFNELINEYITKRVMDIVTTRIDNKYNFINTEFGSWYIGIDILNSDLIKTIFSKFENIIKEAIVEGNPVKIKKILNNSSEKIFDQINDIYSKQLIEARINRKPGTWKNTILDRLNKVDSAEINERNNRFLEVIDESYQKYLKDEKELKEYVDELVKEGKARRIK